MLRAKGARGRRDSLLQDADAAHQSDPRSDSSKKRAEDDRGKGNKEERDREKGNTGESERANEREKSWRTRKLRSVKKMCLCDGACLFLFSLQLVPLSFSCSLSPASPFPLSCCSPLWPFSLSSSALFFLLSLRRDSRRPLAPLALNKENFAVVASRSMTKS